MNTQTQTRTRVIAALSTLVEALEQFRAELEQLDAAPAASPAAGANGAQPRHHALAAGTVPFGACHPPQTGRELFAWLRRTEEESGRGAVAKCVAWGQRHGCPSRICDWADSSVSAAFQAMKGDNP